MKNWVAVFKKKKKKSDWEGWCKILLLETDARLNRVKGCSKIEPLERMVWDLATEADSAKLNCWKEWCKTEKLGRIVQEWCKIERWWKGWCATEIMGKNSAKIDSCWDWAMGKDSAKLSNWRECCEIEQWATLSCWRECCEIEKWGMMVQKSELVNFFFF